MGANVSSRGSNHGTVYYPSNGMAPIYISATMNKLCSYGELVSEKYYKRPLIDATLEFKQRSKFFVLGYLLVPRVEVIQREVKYKSLDFVSPWAGGSGLNCVYSFCPIIETVHDCEHLQKEVTFDNNFNNNNGVLKSKVTLIPMYNLMFRRIIDLMILIVVVVWNVETDTTELHLVAPFQMKIQSSDNKFSGASIQTIPMYRFNASMFKVFNTVPGQMLVVSLIHKYLKGFKGPVPLLESISPRLSYNSEHVFENNIIHGQLLRLATDMERMRLISNCKEGLYALSYIVNGIKLKYKSTNFIKTLIDKNIPVDAMKLAKKVRKQLMILLLSKDEPNLDQVYEKALESVKMISHTERRIIDHARNNEMMTVKSTLSSPGPLGVYEDQYTKTMRMCSVPLPQRSRGWYPEGNGVLNKIEADVSNDSNNNNNNNSNDSSSSNNNNNNNNNSGSSSSSSSSSGSSNSSSNNNNSNFSNNSDNNNNRIKGNPRMSIGTMSDMSNVINTVLSSGLNSLNCNSLGGCIKFGDGDNQKNINVHVNEKTIDKNCNSEDNKFMNAKVLSNLIINNGYDDVYDDRNENAPTTGNDNDVNASGDYIYNTNESGTSGDSSNKAQKSETSTSVSISIDSKPSKEEKSLPSSDTNNDGDENLSKDLTMNDRSISSRLVSFAKERKTNNVIFMSRQNNNENRQMVATDANNSKMKHIMNDEMDNQGHSSSGNHWQDVGRDGFENINVPRTLVSSPSPTNSVSTSPASVSNQYGLEKVPQNEIEEFSGRKIRSVNVENIFEVSGRTTVSMKDLYNYDNEEEMKEDDRNNIDSQFPINRSGTSYLHNKSNVCHKAPVLSHQNPAGRNGNNLIPGMREKWNERNVAFGRIRNSDDIKYGNALEGVINIRDSDKNANLGRSMVGGSVIGLDNDYTNGRRRSLEFLPSFRSIRETAIKEIRAVEPEHIHYNKRGPEIKNEVPLLDVSIPRGPHIGENSMFGSNL